MVVGLVLLMVRRRRAAHQGGAHGGPVVLGQRHNGTPRFPARDLGWQQGCAVQRPREGWDKGASR